MEATQFWTGKRILEETLKHVAPLPSQKEYARALASIFAMHIHRNTLIDDGFAGAIYTQTTDVEIEVNGLMTYDRKVVKLDMDRLSAINRKVIESM